MTEQSTKPIVAVSRTIAAPAAAIFALLADPARHTEIDGSEMLRGLAAGGPVTKVGDTFVMKMHYEQFGDYQMKCTVVELEPGRRIVWEPERVPGIGLEAPTGDEDDDPWHQRWGFELTPVGDGTATEVTETYDCTRCPEDARRIMKDGEVWRQGMIETLTNLERLVTAAAG